MKRTMIFFGALVLSVFAPLALQAAAHQATSSTKPKTVVVIQVRSDDFLATHVKLLVLIPQFKADHIPLIDFDFKASLSDELMNALAQDTRMDWRLATEEEDVNVGYMFDNKKAPIPPSLTADRLLLVDVAQYGAILRPLSSFCYIAARMKLIEKATGKKLWEKSEDIEYDYSDSVKIKLDKKLEELQADKQRGLKEILNRVIEKFCQSRAKAIRDKKI
jgi:hypothetical protein